MISRQWLPFCLCLRNSADYFFVAIFLFLSAKDVFSARNPASPRTIRFVPATTSYTRFEADEPSPAERWHFFATSSLLLPFPDLPDSVRFHPFRSSHYRLGLQYFLPAGSKLTIFFATYMYFQRFVYAPSLYRVFPDLDTARMRESRLRLFYAGLLAGFSVTLTQTPSGKPGLYLGVGIEGNFLVNNSLKRKYRTGSYRVKEKYTYIGGWTPFRIAPLFWIGYRTSALFISYRLTPYFDYGYYTLDARTGIAQPAESNTPGTRPYPVFPTIEVGILLGGVFMTETTTKD